MKVSRKKLSASKSVFFESIGVIVKENDREAIQALKRILSTLEGFKRDYHFYIENKAARLAGISKRSFVKPLAMDRLEKSVDLLIAIGGDGTILRSARHLLSGNSWQKSLILGVNAGHLGFLTFLSMQEAERSIRMLLQNPSKARVDRRSCLEVQVERGGRVIKTFHALNEAVVSKGSLSRIFELHVEIDGEFLSSYRADGLIVSTPTGSTAYNLAAGGSILEPAVTALQLTPICPQSLSNKPIVVSDIHQICLRLGKHSADVFLTLDGQMGCKVGANDRLKITKSIKSIGFVQTPDQNAAQYFHSLRQKLKWGLGSHLAFGRST